MEILDDEIIEEIVFRLPVKSILRFGSVSKPWLSRISDPSFTNLHFTRATAANRTALFISAYDSSTHKQHFFSADHHGGPVDHLMTLHNVYAVSITQPQHLNGFVCFTHEKPIYDDHHAHTFINLNPSTHKIFNLPHPPSSYLTKRHNRLVQIYHLFGFDESRNEHKIVMIRNLHEPTEVEVMIFCMSNYSWRKIDAEPPLGFSWGDLLYNHNISVCVNSVVHLLHQDSYDILGFDLRTEKFIIITTPQGVVPHDLPTPHTSNTSVLHSLNRPQIVRINGCVGVVCADHMLQRNEMHIWILQDYENRVWVKEIIAFPASWMDVTGPVLFPLDANMDEIIFSSSKLSGDQVICVPIYNKKTRCFKSLQFTSGNQFPLSSTLHFDQIRCYVESMVAL